jgi:hypothetical protein
MQWPVAILIFVLLPATALLARGDDVPEKRSNREPSEKRREEWNKLPPEEREARMKEWRKTNGVAPRTESEKRRDFLKNMSPEERAAKRLEIKGRLEKRIAELQLQKVNGTLTAQEGRELERREQVLKRFEQETVPRVERPKPVLTNAPSRSPD